MHSHQITELLKSWNKGDPDALEKLVPLVYDELYSRARNYLLKERRDHTLSTTALVNEAFLRLINEKDRTFENRQHFMAVAATIMRHLLIHHAEARNTQKRGGSQTRVSMETLEDLPVWDDHRLLDLDQALSQLHAADPRKAHIFELRYFLGFSLQEIITETHLSLATIKRELQFARAWLRKSMSGKNDDRMENP